MGIVKAEDGGLQPPTDTTLQLAPPMYMYTGYIHTCAYTHTDTYIHTYIHT